MKLFIKFTFFALSTMFFFTGCTVTVDEEEEIDMSTVISDDPVTGSLSEGEDFVLMTALVQKTTLFDDAGYDFKLFSTDQSCEQGAIPVIQREIDFFVASETALELKEYDGLGPFIRNTSFFGCKVIITSISDTSISGKVKGGDPSGDKWVEGSFTAALCK